MGTLLLVIGLLMFVGLVIVHELGHFLAARRNGVVVEEFGIGFPPRAWSKRTKNGMILSLNWLPLGGFVRLKGEHDSDKGKGAYGRASLLAKTKIMVAGVAMNLITAFILLTFLAIVGIPRIIEDQFNIASDTEVVSNKVLVGYVEQDSPASRSGLMQRDEIRSIKIGDQDPIELKGSDSLPKITEKAAGREVEISYLRNGKDQKNATVQLRTKDEVDNSKKTNDPKGYLGISPAEYTITRSTWSAPVMAIGFMKQLTVATFNGIGSAVSNLLRGNTTKASEQVSGPVGIFVLLKDGSMLGYQFILLVVAIISLTLAIMNILPIPALDGGRLFVTFLFRIIKKPLTKNMEERIHGTGFALLMALFVLITFVDIRRFF